MNNNSGSGSLNISYPCKWSYKIIGSDAEELIAAVEETITNLEYDITPSNISSNEKYLSLNVQVLVPSEIMRNIIFQQLSKHPAIKIVI